MKSLCLFAVSAALLGFALTGCEQHSLEETGKLHLEHGRHAEGHGEGHGDAGHAKEGHAKDDHAKEGHGEAAPEVKVEAEKEEPRKTGL